jgi:hypothetical protein
MKTWALTLAVAAALFTGPVEADTPYAGQQGRSIKALSDDNIAALRKGEGMGTAKAAELNGYPGPKHVLDLAQQLQLTDVQRREVQGIFDRMSAAARPLGGELIAQEKVLDRLFAKRDITPDRLASATAASCRVDCARCIYRRISKTRAVLNRDQIARYKRLRGYANPLLRRSISTIMADGR